jgi:hypothetical protein
MMNKVLKPLKQLANKHDTAICIVHHNKKAATDQNGSRAGNDMLGAVGLHAWVDCAVYARSKNGHGEISVEREAKMAQDMPLKIKIPTMYWDMKTGDRKLWDPEIITEGLETVQEPMPKEAKHEPGTAGKQMAMKVKMMAAYKPVTMEQLQEVLDKPASTILKQLEAAIDNGYLEEVEEGKWAVVK